MVRFYCLTSIKRASLNDVMFAHDRPTEVDTYTLNYYGNNTIKTMEKIKNNPEIFNSYQLTEISIGYSFNNESMKKVFLMFIFRNDTGLIVINMIPGVVKFYSISNLLHEFIVATSKLFPDVITFDIQIKIRCIKNTQVRGPITKEEEQYYEKYAQEIESFCKNDKDLQESAFEKLPFALPNLSKPNVLRQKISDISTLIKLLCDPETGNIKNVPNDARYNQKVKCSSLEQKSSTKLLDAEEVKTSKNDLEPNQKHLQHTKSETTASEADKTSLDDFLASFFGTNSSSKYVHTSSGFSVISSYQEVEDNSRNTLTSDAISEILSVNEYYNLQSRKRRYPTDKELKTIHKRRYGSYQERKALKRDQNEKLLRCSNLCRIHPQLNYNNLAVTNQSVMQSHAKSLSEMRMQNGNVSDARLRHYFKIYDYTNLTNIVLKNCDLIELHDFNILPLSVTHLDLSNNNIKLISNSISRLFNLMSFNISGNRDLDESKIPWTELPSSIINLDITKTNITIIPHEIEKMNKLETLIAGNGPLKRVAWERIGMALRYLSIENSEIHEIGNISHLTSVSRLKANSNKIYSISEAIGALQELTVLELENNNLRLIPNSFINLKVLKFLNLRNNNFNFDNGRLNSLLWERLPKNLSVLILNNNNLNELPCSLQDFEFCHLAVNNCKLTNICPYFLTNSRKNEFLLEIADNPELQNLQIVPKTIFPHVLETDESQKDVILANLNILTNNEEYIITSKFGLNSHTPREISSQKCNCCASCGKLDDENFMERIMIMDFNLCISKPKNDYDIFSFKQAIDENPEDIINRYREKFSQKVGRVYAPGEWKTNVNIRLCPECSDCINKQINAIDQLCQYFRESSTTTDTQLTVPFLIPQVYSPSTIHPSDQTRQCFQKSPIVKQKIAAKNALDSTAVQSSSTNTNSNFQEIKSEFDDNLQQLLNYRNAVMSDYNSNDGPWTL